LDGWVGGTPVQHRNVGLRGLRFHAALAVTLQGGIVDALGVFQIARQQGGFFALLLQCQHLGLLPFERAGELAEALAGGARGGADTAGGSAEFVGELGPVAAHLGLQADEVGMVGPHPIGQFGQLAFALRHLRLEVLHHRVVDDLRQVALSRVRELASTTPIAPPPSARPGRPCGGFSTSSRSSDSTMPFSPW